MENHFRKYVGQSLEGLGVLSHTLHRLIQMFLPNLGHHFDQNENIISGGIGTNWILTLFTTLKKFKNHIRLLDQVFDIFMGQGWIGFFKCVLVLFYYLEEDIITLKNDQMMIFLNNFTQNGFQKLGETLITKKSKPSVSSKVSLKLPSDMTGSNYGQLNQVPLFNFKQDVTRFNIVNKLLLVQFSLEYHTTKQTFDRKWTNIQNRLDYYKNT